MKHLFILCSPRSGSTMFYTYLSRCKNISTMGQDEGDKYLMLHGFPNTMTKGLPTRKPEFFNDEKNYNFDKVKEIYNDAWDKKDDDRVYLEKSTCNSFRYELLDKHFENSFFIVLNRHPHAIIEGWLRHFPGTDNPRDLKLRHFTADWILYSKSMIEAKKHLENRCIIIRYEDLCDNTETTKNKIIEFLPELNDINFEEPTTCSTYRDLKGRNNKPLENENRYKIESLSKDDIKEINTTFDTLNNVYQTPETERLTPTIALEILKYFNYEI